MANRSVAANLMFALCFVVPIGISVLIDILSGGRVRDVLPLHLPMWWFGLVTSVLLAGTLAVIVTRSGQKAFATGGGRGEISVRLSEVELHSGK
jgi:hypothetical protein